MSEDFSTSVTAVDAGSDGGVARWPREALRSALGRAPRWDGLRATPLGLVALMAASLLLSVAAQRLVIVGDAHFHPAAIDSQWLGTLISLWLCWRVVEGRADASAGPPDVALLFALLIAQSLLISMAGAVLLVPLIRAQATVPAWAPMLAWSAVALWQWAAAVVLLGRQLSPGPRRHARRALVALVLALPWGLVLAVQPPSFWFPTAEAEAADAPATLRLTPELIERQGQLLDEAAERLVPQRAGVIDVYAIGFAPFAGEDVFKRELALVDGLMRERFDADGRTLRLLNHADTAAELPWASAENLRRAIAAAAARMDRDEDILFVHLTSHGGRDGRLEAHLWPLQLDPVTPQQLRGWLDEAGVRWRVLSVSACYAGSWIAPLAGDGTLVMTAADAEHTSYGCGRGSELTFFGRAMYRDALRRTRNFESAHATARQLIEQREKDAGKDDGFSNPQVSMGAALRPRLAELEAALDAGGPKAP